MFDFGVLFWHFDEWTYYVNLFNGSSWDQRVGAKNEKWKQKIKCYTNSPMHFPTP